MTDLVPTSGIPDSQYRQLRHRPAAATVETSVNIVALHNAFVNDS